MKGVFHSTKAAFSTLGRFLMLAAYLYAERTISSLIRAWRVVSEDSSYALNYS